jgi:hypothetical protein
MASKRKKPIERHPYCRGRKCRSCTWDSLHITVDGPHPRYTKGHRGFYNGDIDAAIDDFLTVLKGESRRLLRDCAAQTPALKQSTSSSLRSSYMSKDWNPHYPGDEVSPRLTSSANLLNSVRDFLSIRIFWTKLLELSHLLLLHDGASSY